MKFIANTETIRNLLSIVTRALSVRPSQPVLEGVLIEVRENCLLLTASDGMFTIHASTEVNEVEPGTCSRRAASFWKPCASCPMAK